MKNFTITYQRFTKATALLLPLAFLIPSGLQAKQLAEYCMMEMSHHDKMEMADDHSCCTEEAPSQHHSHKKSGHDCESNEMEICACEIDLSYFEATDTILISNEFVAYLPKQFDLTPFTTADESIHHNQSRHLYKHSPPIWLMYDTLLL